MQLVSFERAAARGLTRSALLAEVGSWTTASLLQIRMPCARRQVTERTCVRRRVASQGSSRTCHEMQGRVRRQRVGFDVSSDTTTRVNRH